MILKKINSEFLKEYPYLNNIKLTQSENSASELLHPLLTFNTGLVLRTLKFQDSNRLIIWVPSSEKLAQWLTTLLSLEMYKKDYQQNSKKKSSFIIGQKLLINSAIVEYAGEEWDEKWGLMFKIKYRDGNDSIVEATTPGLEHIFFQVTDTQKRLSNNKQVHEAIKSIKLQNFPIDQILEIRSYANRSYVKNTITLVSRIGETEDFITNQTINESPIDELVGWAKVDSYGFITSLDGNKIVSQPSCLLASSLYSLSENDDKDKYTKRIIIDGTAKCISELPLLDDMLDQNSDVIVISDLTDQDGIRELLKRDFKVWKWSKELIKEVCEEDLNSQNSLFTFFNNKLNQFCNQNVNIESVNDETIESLSFKAHELIRLLPEDQQDLVQAKYELVAIINGILRMIRPGEKEWSEDKVIALEKIKHKFEIHSQWLNDEAKKCMQELLEVLYAYVNNIKAQGSQKTIKMSNLLKTYLQNPNINGRFLLILCSSSSEAVKTELFWKNTIPELQNRNIKFLSSENLSENAGEKNEIIVCGWLGIDKMNRVVNSLYSDNIKILCFNTEQRWYESARKYWDQIYDFGNIDCDLFAQILDIPAAEIKYINKSVSDVVDNTAEIDELKNLEYKLKKQLLNKYITSGNKGEDLVLAKPVSFSSDRLAFFTETHKMYLLNDLLSGSSTKTEIPNVFVNDLKVGDKVLFRDSNRDIIRDIAEQMLNNSGKAHLSLTARLWKKALKEEFDRQYKNFHRLVRVLKECGCNRHPTTLKQWVLDEDQIGPRDLKDLQIIAIATNSQELKTRMEEVQSAILEVRSAHQQASAFLVKSLKEAVIKKIASGSSSDRDSDASIDLGQFGSIFILTVDELTDDWLNVDRNKVNKLLRREE